MNAAGRTLLILTEGDRRRGLGHVGRCSAYGEYWRDHGGTVQWLLDGDASAKAMAAQVGRVRLGVWQDGRDAPPNADVAIIDSYRLTAKAQRDLVDRFAEPIFIDDLQAHPYPRGLVVHPALDIAPLRADGAVWLTGPSWLPLRAAFQAIPRRAAAREAVRRVLIATGGGDPRGLAEAAVQAVRTVFPEARIDLITGQSEAASIAGVVMHRAVPATVVATLMHSADLAISTAGTTTFELACSGVPTVLVGVADNQQPNLDALPGRCGFVSADRIEASDLQDRLRSGLAGLAEATVRGAVSARAQSLVDGQGVPRLFDHLQISKAGRAA